MKKGCSLKLDRFLIDSYLSSSTVARQILSIEISTNTIYQDIYRELRNSDFQIWFWPMLMYLCRVSFLTTLNIYKVYFKGCHIREYKENMCKRWLMSYSLWKKLLRLCALGFCNQVLLDLHCWWTEELCSQHLLQVGELVTYWNPCKNGGVHILKSSEVLKR